MMEGEYPQKKEEVSQPSLGPSNIWRSEKGEGSSKVDREEIACGVGEKSGKFNVPEGK